jgi:hypothetical protein
MFYVILGVWWILILDFELIAPVVFIIIFKGSTKGISEKCQMQILHAPRIWGFQGTCM